jgi:hypothetical protein
MPVDEKLTPADTRDLADAVTFTLRFDGRRRVHSADEYMATIAAERVVRHLERAGFVVSNGRQKLAEQHSGEDSRAEKRGPLSNQPLPRDRPRRNHGTQSRDDRDG